MCIIHTLGLSLLLVMLQSSQVSDYLWILATNFRYYSMHVSACKCFIDERRQLEENTCATTSLTLFLLVLWCFCIVVGIDFGSLLGVTSFLCSSTFALKLSVSPLDVLIWTCPMLLSTCFTQY